MLVVDAGNVLHGIVGDLGPAEDDRRAGRGAVGVELAGRELDADARWLRSVQNQWFQAEARRQRAVDDLLGITP